MHEYARQRGLRRIMLPVPVLTPRLSSLWLGLVTPLYARVGRKLIQSIRHPTVVRDDSARLLFAIEPLGVREAIAQALRNEDCELAESRWSDALSASGGMRQYGGVRFGNRLLDVRTVEVPAPSAVAFRPIQRIGGGTGWYYGNWLWTLRWWVDLLMGVCRNERIGGLQNFAELGSTFESGIGLSSSKYFHAIGKKSGLRPQTVNVMASTPLQQISHKDQEH